jgi:hypothetical protein
MFRNHLCLSNGNIREDKLVTRLWLAIAIVRFPRPGDGYHQILSVCGNGCVGGWNEMAIL